MWHVVGNIWDQSSFMVLSQSWWFKNLTFRCIFVNLILPYHILGGPFICLFIYLFFGRRAHGQFSREIFLKTQGFAIPRQEVLESKWNHKFHLASLSPFYQHRSVMFFSEIRAFIKTTEHKWILQPAFVPFMTWKPALHRQDDWPFPPLQNPYLAPPNVPWHFLNGLHLLFCNCCSCLNHIFQISP